MSHGIANPYLGYTIFQFHPKSEGEVQTLHDLEEERNDGVIFLTRAYNAAIGSPTDVLVKPSLKDEFVTKLNEKGCSPKVIGCISCDSKCVK